MALCKCTVEKRVREYKNAIDSGLNILKNNDTLIKWVNHYLETIESEVMCDNIKESEYKTLKARLQYFVDYKGGLLAKTKLNDILPPHIQPAINELYKKNPSTGKLRRRKLFKDISELSLMYSNLQEKRDPIISVILVMI